MNSLLIFILISLISSIFSYRGDKKRRDKQFAKQKKRIKEKDSTKKYIEYNEEKEELMPQLLQQVDNYNSEYPLKESYAYDSKTVLTSVVETEVENCSQRVSERVKLSGKSKVEEKGLKKCSFKKIPLKDAFLWKEILDKPVSMRKDA